MSQGLLPATGDGPEGESLQGFQWKCFLDAYKGYHQILMSTNDEEKTTFYTDHDAFYYKKNAIRIEECLGNLLATVYVDDMAIKSPNERRLLRDVEETLQTLEKANMKLNLVVAPGSWYVLFLLIL
uniref:Uncharacterized protein n=1 Tax=Lactuca sativa TaxID=4236 RepID=A0A9R1UDY8_LACSA|nr:hypothetical protein LSAT_V11C900462450 [Lactuca sativa]